MKFGNLDFTPAVNHPELLVELTIDLLKNWSGETPVEEILVSEIDPEFADSLNFCDKYNIRPEDGANCLIVESKRAGEVKHAAVLVPVDKRADINNIVRKTLNASSISFASREFAVEATGMEFGSITVVGLPKDWPILIDEDVIKIPHLILGGGLRKSKLLVPGKALAQLPNAKVLNLKKA